MQTVIGAFDDQATAQRAVEQLVQAGIPRHDIHVEQQGTQQPMGSGENRALAQQREESSGSGGKGFFASLFGSDDEGASTQQNQYVQHASTYDEAVRRGSAVVVVDAQDESQADRACTLLHEAGAVDVDERSQQWRADGWQPSRGTGQQQDSAAAVGRDGLQPNQEGVVDVVEEQLKVGKRSLDRGGVRVIQRVSSKPVRELLRLREEHAVVERRPVDRPVTGSDLNTFHEGTVEVHEMVEEPVVSKSAHVVEEVHVTKDVREREETIEDTVRRKDVDVERLAANNPRERAVAADKDPGTTRQRNAKDKPGL